MAVAAQRYGVRVVAFQKCGHTSIINTFRTPRGSKVVRGADGLDDLLSGPSTEDWPPPVVTAAYVRHPLARLVSVYHHLVRPFDTYREKFDQFGMYGGMPFQTFCDRICSVATDVDADPHTKRQVSSLIEMGSGTSWLARLEEIYHRWPVMVATFNLDCAIIPAQFNVAEHTNWTLMYHRHRKADIDALLDVYRDDVNLWENL